MPSQPKKSYILGDYRLETDSQLLSREGQRVHLPKRPFQVLLYLIEHRDQVVSRSDLLDLFWEGKDVYDDSLRKCVGTVRKALGDPSAQPRFIETRYAGGYRFIGPVEELERQPPAMIETVKTRAVKIVVEEEIHDDGAATRNHPIAPSSVVTETATTGQLQTLSRPQPRSTAESRTLNSTRSQLSRSLVIVGLVAVALALGTMVILRSRASSASRTVDQSLTSRSIAVLPLKNLTGDANDEYLSDGLTDSLINELARINNLKVISRASSFTFKGQETDAREVGRRLGVANILEGSIRKSGDRIRINLRLVSTADGRVVWTGDSFDRALTDIFTVQDEISCSVAENLRVILCGEQSHKRYTENVAAYQAYLKGRYHWNKRTPEGIRKSIAHYQQAIALDGNYALAFAGLADSYVQGIWRVPFAPDFALPKAIEAAQKAIALDDSLAEAHTALASAYQLDWNWAGTERELQRAIELNPQYARAHHVYAFHLSALGRWDESLAAIKRAQELDPLNLVINSDIAMITWNGRSLDSGRVDAALAQCGKVVEMDANYAEIHEYLALAYWLKGRPEKFAEEYIKARELNGNKPELVAAYKEAYKTRGVNGIFRRELNGMLAARAKGTYQSTMRIAQLYALLGDKETAFQWLEKAYQEHNPEIVGLKAFPLYDPLRDDPRFNDLQRRAGLL